MTKWEEFNSSDLQQIRRKINYKYERALILTLAISIPLFFISPYIPGKSSPPLIETRSYWDAVFYFMLYWGILIFIVAIYNIYRAKKDYERITLHLKIKTQSDTIHRIYAPFLELSYRKIYFKSIGNYIIDRDLLDDFKKDDKVEIRVEINSLAVLSIKKMASTMQDDQFRIIK